MDKYDEIILPEEEQEEDTIKKNQLMMELSDTTVPVSFDKLESLIRQSERLERALNYVAVTKKPEIRTIRVLMKMPVEVEK